jgi:PAS domain S-box-containing protein
MVGSGIYMNSIDKVIQQKEVELDKRIQKRVVQVLILFFLILLIILYFLYKQSAKINNSFKLFHNILQQAHKKISIINLDKIDFIEFKELAIDFNNMVNIVQNNINNLDKIVKDKTANLSKINRELKESKREVVLINENLTEQKTAFKDLFQKTSDGITIIKDGKFVDCNDAIMKMLKYKTKDQLLNVHPSELSPEFQPDGEDSFTKANRMMQIAIDTGSNTFEWVHLRANGEEFWAEIVLTQMIQNRETIIHVVWRDISKRKQIEFELEQLTSDLELRIKEEVQKNREKDKAMLQQSKLAQMGELLSMIAHQWRQPLTAISATSNDLSMKIMLDNYSEDYFSEKLKKIVELSQHLSNTIDDFRTFNKEDKEKTAVLFSTLVKSVLGIVSISIENNNIDLTTDFKCEKKMLTYSNEVKQVILNLIKNAEDILLEKNIQKAYIHLKTYDDENYTYLKISDNAGGVPEDIIDKIFNPYFSTKTKKDGTGLGLYMSKIIIEEHCGGELSVYNDENGAVFEIKLDGKQKE